MTQQTDYSSNRNEWKAPSQAAAEYIARGWKPIPVPAGEKGPRDPDWPARTYQHFTDSQNIGVQMGPQSGGLTDVDLDCAEAIQLASHFLPRTDAIFGRASKPRSHWLYKINDPDPKANIKLWDEEGKTIVELRMGGGGKGAQTVFPGSTHPSGERIAWEQGGEPAVSTCALLKAAITNIAVAAILARHWPEHGNRHEAAMRCGGFLARAGWEPEAIEGFMTSVQMVAGVDDHRHIKDGCDAALFAATSYLDDGRGYGLPALKEFFGDEVGNRIAQILQYGEIDTNETLERMNEKFFVIPLRNKARVGTFKQDHTLNRLVATFFSVNDFKILEYHPRIAVGEGENRKKIGRGAWWLGNPQRQQYSGLVFIPGGAKVIGTDLNLWRNWGIDPKKGSWRLLLRHIYKVLANKNKGHFKFIVRWIAWALQNPASMAEVALVFRGEQGSGKGVFGRTLCQAFGQHGLQISAHQHLTGRFNAHQMDCAFLFADEAFWPGDKSAEGTLKRIVTEPTNVIEFKGVDTFLVKNALKLILSSNAQWVVPAAIDDRRFAVFDVSNKYKQDKKYFAPLYHEIEHGGIAAMMYDLLRMNLRGWHPRYNVPKTTALLDQKYHSLSPEWQWWGGILLTGELPGPMQGDPRLAASWAILDSVQKSAVQLRFVSQHRLARMLRDFGCERNNNWRINGQRAWRFPVLQEARSTWDRRFGIVSEWEPADDWQHPEVVHTF
jgi:hypothetical protein